jgi:hypothetical protein
MGRKSALEVAVSLTFWDECGLKLTSGMAGAKRGRLKSGIGLGYFA